VPRLKCTFAEFIEIERYHFVLERHEGGSHRLYRGNVNGSVQKVTVAFHRKGEEIKPDTLASMIRQTGLPKNLFRK
jgi:predicted RNA binding protein YcfA (HicA-like mRNA interferase family)